MNENTNSRPPSTASLSDACSPKAAVTSEPTELVNSLSTNARAFSIDALLSQQDSGVVSDDSDSEIEVEEVTKNDSGENTQDKNITKQLSPSMDALDELSEDNCKTSDTLAKSQCHLEMTDLWKKFYELGTEMIITKSGRRMFPSLRISFTNLDPKANYQVFFDIAPVDNKRYRYTYHRSSWLVAGRADPPIPRRIYTHPDGPFRGDSLMKQSLSFEKVKLTNNIHDRWGYVILNSMHKYQPRVHLVKYEEKVPSGSLLSDIVDLDRKSFAFSETQFIGVTAYQNQLITKLKIDSNPFAKGFRDSARITQMDRESVDLLIKASRNGYPQIPTSHVPSIFPEQLHLPILQSTMTSKYPSLLPLPPPTLTSHRDGMHKDFLKAYLDKLTGSTNILTPPYKAPTMQALKAAQLRFNPYRQ
ncbi:T-box transcription factor TBX20-like [Watersipora subatra]|uniref:T-box transcription factor TBX20-like n=1 Tax=Watersipora subatra TaxID=2589382 RepID=UPI00355BB092